MVQQAFASVDEYVASFPKEVQRCLQSIRTDILEVVPEATERISYHMPTIDLDGKRLTYFAGWKRHVALYAIPVFDDDLEADIAPYRSTKDTVRFTVAEPIPDQLITRIVEALVTKRG
ncbi:iron chaperone [Plantibacter sp. Mn2098]|uniref:iron chaperone n=1 Tax=Plantibacter sp. Mn2098 TaxID=3395266 RepID=UPI003BC6A930